MKIAALGVADNVHHLNLTPNERQARSDEVFRRWLAGAETGWLECRYRNRHSFPGLTSKKTHLAVDRKTATVEQISECESCTTTLTIAYDLRGEWLTGERGSPPIYDWPDGYLLPHEARGDEGLLNPERRMAIRAELRSRAITGAGLNIRQATTA